MTTTQYTATLNERWDAISQANYGTPYQYERIQRANPQVTDPLYMLQGRVLLIPVVDASEVAETTAVNTDSLPPWKR